MHDRYDIITDRVLNRMTSEDKSHASLYQWCPVSFHFVFHSQISVKGHSKDTEITSMNVAVVSSLHF